MIVLSLFDGMSCGQIALNKIGKKPSIYYASEIDKHAQIVSKANYPDTVYLGDVRNVNVSELQPIDLLIGGSPCQSFSFAGKRKGMSTKDNIEILTIEHYLELKEQNFEFEGQSYLFWEYMRILKDIQKYNPNVKFLLENVLMGEKWKNVLSRAIGINPIQINSALVSAQNRNRLYWTNIGAESDGFFGDLVCKIKHPKDKGIYLKDILENNVDKKYYLSDKALKGLIRASQRQHKPKFHINHTNKSSCIDTRVGAGSHYGDYICVASRGRETELATEQRLEPRNDGKTNCLTSVQKDNLLIHNMMPRSSKSGKGSTGHLTRNDGKTYCLDTGNTNAIEFLTNNKISENQSIRRLTPLECERLQTVPDNYTNYVSDSQRYRMLGNGWTVDVIAHIFNYLD